MTANLFAGLKVIDCASWIAGPAAATILWLTISSPFNIDGETKVAPQRAPTVGQHSDAVLREAGYTEDEIKRLHELGVLA